MPTPTSGTRTEIGVALPRPSALPREGTKALGGDRERPRFYYVIRITFESLVWKFESLIWETVA